MTKLTYTIIDTRILSPDMVQSVDKTILRNVLIIDYRMLIQTDKHTTDNSILQCIFSSSAEFQKLFNKYKDVNNNVDLICYKIMNKDKLLYSYVVLASYPSLAFTLIELSNIDYDTFTITTLYNDFVQNQNIKQKLIHDVIDKLLDINSNENYAKITLYGEHHHNHHDNKVTGIHVKKLDVKDIKLDVISFNDEDIKMIYNICRHIDDRDKYETFVLYRILSLVNREAINNKHKHEFTIEILAIHKEVMYSIYCEDTANEAIKEALVEFREENIIMYKQIEEKDIIIEENAKQLKEKDKTIEEKDKIIARLFAQLSKLQSEK